MDTRRLEDLLASRLMCFAAILSGLIVFVIIIVLLGKSIPILKIQPIDELLFSSSWYPLKGQFGFYPFIIGTVWVTGLAMILAIPPSLMMSIYVSEYAPTKIRGIIKPMVDLLAGIPSVVYGLWGVLFLVPLIRDDLAPMVGVTTTGYTVLSGSIVLAIMVFPTIIAISDEVLRASPQEARQASMALGATKWQTVKHVVIRSTLPGIVAAVILGFGRAFGETMAVLMVVGNVPKVPNSIFDPAYPLTALIANNYGEMMSIPLYESGLMFSALLLMVTVVLFNIIAGIMFTGIRRRYILG